MKSKVFLVLALFALMAVGVYAQTEADFGVSKSADGKSITIDEYKGKAKVVNIPAKIQNLPVTGIGLGAFRDDLNITSVTIPNGVTIIGESAFNSCHSLTSVTIPNSVTSIGKNAFSAIAITSVTIPNGVKSIENQTFSNCSELTSITIPNSVTSIGTNAFNGCFNLTSVTFTGSIPASGFDAKAFNSVGDIRDKYLAAGGGAGTYTRPSDGTAWTKGATATAAPAAAGTPGLEFNLNADGKGYTVSQGSVIRGNVVIPASYNNLPVTTIKVSAFNNGGLVESVIIPASVTYIGMVAFSKCTNLKSVTFGGANTSIENPDTNFPGDLGRKYKAGGAGTYTKSDTTWTKQ